MSDRPDPALDLIGFLRWLGDHVEALERGHDEERLNPTEAARALGFKTTYFAPSRYPWRIPEYGAHGTLHPLATWRTWITESPDRARRAEWDAIPLRERSKILGLSYKEAS